MSLLPTNFCENLEQPKLRFLRFLRNSIAYNSNTFRNPFWKNSSGLGWNCGLKWINLSNFFEWCKWGSIGVLMYNHKPTNHMWWLIRYMFGNTSIKSRWVRNRAMTDNCFESFFTTCLIWEWNESNTMAYVLFKQNKTWGKWCFTWWILPKKFDQSNSRLNSLSNPLSSNASAQLIWDIPLNSFRNFLLEQLNPEKQR